MQVRIHEVGARDGLQNEPGTLATAAKLELLARLAEAGLTSIEVTSFVSPKWIPQLADADEVVAGLVRRPGVRYSALVPNASGFERFQGTALDDAAFFVSASETHNRKNVNRGVEEHLERFKPVAEQILASGAGLRCYVSTVCGCPYEGDVAAEAVVELVRRLDAMGAEEISLGDTIGIGTPDQVRRVIRAVREVVPLERIALHPHDTYGRALANLQAGLEEGIRIFDTSLGGLGGCPYAPGASGNVATEDVVDLLEREGIDTGIDLRALVEATSWIEEQLGRPLPGRVFRALGGGRAEKS
ncbi:MAG: hydroxymethylglutaryl-CoA lyase [bacterium]|nr:hydroxymethylglutaryl-CoA lyase [bacterium]